MTVFKKVGLCVVVAMISLFAFEVSERLSVPGVHSFVSTADAVVGRPLSPVSVAGVARRSAR